MGASFFSSVVGSAVSSEIVSTAVLRVADSIVIVCALKGVVLSAVGSTATR